MWQIKPLAAPDWPTLAPFVHATNRRADGRCRCLHAEQGDSIESHERELRSLGAAQACFVAAREAGELVGMAGAVIDAGLLRAWVRGPLTAQDDAMLRAALLDALLRAMPQRQRLDAFPSVDEASLRTSLRAAGFRDRFQFHVMSRAADAVPPPAWPAAVHDANEDEAARAAQLHTRLFPNTYLDAAALVSTRDAAHRLLVVAGLAGEPAGYLYVRDSPLDDEAYVDFLGVAEAERGRGVGRRLLDAALHWGLGELQRARVSLTVQQGRAPALGLYESAGFRELAAGAQMVFERAVLTPP